MEQKLTDKPSPVSSPAARESAPAQHRRAGLLFRAEQAGLPALWLVVIIAFTIAEPGTFLTIGNFSNILGPQAALLALTLAALLPSINGDFDLSIGALSALVAMSIALLNSTMGIPIVLACVIGLAIGAAAGAVSGAIVVRFGNDPFIVTLGTGTVFTGIVYAISGSNTINLSSTDLSQWVYIQKLLGIPIEFYYGLVLLAIVWYITTLTPMGQRSVFVGQSREVSRLSGIRVGRVRFGAFVGAGLLAAVSGILFLGTTGSATPSDGDSFLLPAYAAVFLGATSIQPGRFNAIGAAIAVYFLATAVSGLQILGAQNYVQQLFYGGALVIAVTLSRIVRKQRERGATAKH
jgi:ribose transport system permease protein